LHSPRRAVLIMMSLALAASAIVLAGCGKSGTDAESTAPSRTNRTPHTAASGPAVSGTVSFDQLTLESAPKTTKDKNGLSFLRFKYADNDGKVYECVLPAAMSEGQYTLGEWLSTFNAYRLPKVLAQKKVLKQENLGDYPFISPKPRSQQTGQEQPGGTPPDTSPPILPEGNAPPPPGSGPPGTAPPPPGGGTRG